MILPSTYFSVVVLLLLSLVCLGSWINTFKAAGARWRFELFSIDFSLGGILVVLLAAYTLGSLGADLPFGDRILVAGRTAQALAVAAGAVFNLGNMLLLAAVSLLGISTAFPLALGIGLIVATCFHFHQSNLAYLIASMVIMLACVAFEVRSAWLREVDAPAARNQPARPAQKPPARKSVRGILVAVIAGLALGFVVPLLWKCVPGDFGLGSYAGMLLFGIGVLFSTIVYNFYFLNITIEGSPLTFRAYFRGNRKQHLLGFAGGAVCLAGLLSAVLASSASTTNISPALDVILPLLSVPLAFFFGIAKWKELAVAAGRKTALVAGICLFTASLGLLAFGFTQ